MSVETLKKSYIECAKGKDSSVFTEGYAYTTAFINVLKMLYFLMNTVQSGKAIKYDINALTMIDLFDPEQVVETVKFADQAKVYLAITNCFNLLNDMLSKEEVRKHLFANKKRIEAALDIDALIAQTRAAFREKLADPEISEKYQAAKSNGTFIDVEPVLNRNVTTNKFEYLIEIRELFAKFLERFGNAVQVFLRIKPLKDTTPSGKATLPCVSSDTAYSASDYTEIFDDAKVNRNIYDRLNVHGVFKNALLGYNTIIFGYGYSGSGKTYTLLEKGEGLIYQMLKDPEFNVNEVKIDLVSVFEMYGSVDHYHTAPNPKAKSTTQKLLSGQTITVIDKQAEEPRNIITCCGQTLTVFYGDITEQELLNMYTNNPIPITTNVANNISQFKLKLQNLVKKGVERPTEDDLRLLDYLKTQAKTIWDTSIDKYLPNTLECIDKWRKLIRHITDTPNNPESSRGHLFIVLKVSTKTTSSFMTFVDMAGVEDVIDIIRSQYREQSDGSIVFYDKRYGEYAAFKRENYTDRAKAGFENVDKPLGSVIAGHPQQRVLREGFYINETINHMKSFFMRNLFKDNIQIPPVKMTFDDIFMSQSTYEPHMVVVLPERLYKLTRGKPISAANGKYNYTFTHIHSKFQRPLDQEKHAWIPSIDESKQTDASLKRYYVPKLENILIEKNGGSDVLIQYMVFTPSNTVFVLKSPRRVIVVDHTVDINLEVFTQEQLEVIKQLRENFISSLKRVLMIPVLRRLTTMSQNSTKFVMMCCVRQEEKYCKETLKTLNFAKSVSSQAISKGSSSKDVHKHLLLK